ncbi:MAG TPA: hypothetical protein VFA71_04050 [Terriglobales bacterium]|nr:hypothetical protein [Terriglobales bacterium]
MRRIFYYSLVIEKFCQFQDNSTSASSLIKWLILTPRGATSWLFAQEDPKQLARTWVGTGELVWHSRPRLCFV